MKRTFAILALSILFSGVGDAQSGDTDSVHWAYEKPVRPTVPSATPWTRNEIDCFVAARLEEHGLTPAPVADPASLARRLAFDLTGLPLDLDALDAHLLRGRGDAWTRLVDDLTGSIHHAERMAMMWMDAARYADTNGFSIDGGRHMWRWRDGVVQAFARNQPFDEFTIEQLAGDLIPDGSLEQRIASGFNRNHMITHEGGTILEEYRVQYVADRVATTSTVWMGLTSECARCHDHKYDPLTQRDYYRLFAFFNSITDKGNDGNGGKNSVPFIDVPIPDAERQRAELEERLAAARRALDAAASDDAGRAPWEAALVRDLATEAASSAAPPELRVTSAISEVGADVSDLGDGSWLVGGRLPERDTYVVEAETDAEDIAGIVVEALAHDSLPKGGPGRVSHGNFVLTELEARVRVGGREQRLAFARASADHAQQGYPARDAFDGKLRSGWAVAPKYGVDHTATFVFKEPLRASGNKRLTVRLHQRYGSHHVIGRFRLTLLTGRTATVPHAVRVAVVQPIEERPAGGAAAVIAHYRATAGALSPRRDRIAVLEREVAAARAASRTSVMVMEEMGKPRDAFVLERGQYDQHGEKVAPGTPSFLPPLVASGRATRLDLARWLVHPDHPLTSRVMVNRLWAMFFGTGLVATIEDFGTRGAAPSHPELLDWLATELIRRDWDLRAIIRLIVDSATYRQSSRTRPDVVAVDPLNRYLAQGPRFRLTAESIRDQALAVSGLLVRRVGGPGVKPYQPPGLWKEMSHFGSTPATAQIFEQDHGEALWRRSLYTYWKRTVPPPNMATFDAPNRETCVVRRQSTTTPLQALVLLNDPTFVEAARALAERTLRRGDGDDRARASRMFRRCTGRLPERRELEVLIRMLGRERARFRADEHAAADILSVGEAPRDPGLEPAEHAAWTQVALALLNLTETVTRS